MGPQPKHPLLGLLIAQFLVVFNGSAWKFLVVLLAIKGAAAEVGESGPAYEAFSQTQTTVAFVVFTLPLMLMSLPASVLADRLSKRSVLVAMKALEVALLAVGTAALFVAPSGGVVPLVVLGLLGVQGAVFSPAKYGILPEILPHERLSAGNGTLEMWTFFGVIAGIGAGGALLDLTGRQVWIAGAVLTALAGAGLLAAWGVPHVPPAGARGGVLVTLRSGWGALRGERILWLSVLGSAFYWAVASLVGQDILIYAKAVLRLSDTPAVVPLAVFGVGVGVGSVLAGKLSASKVEYGLIPLGATGLALFTLLLGLLGPGFAGTLVLMALLGIASGFLVVPLNALIQWQAPEDRRGAVIALGNVFIFGGILAGSLGAEALSRAGLSSRGIFLGAAAVTLAGTAWALWTLPQACLRLVLVLLTHTLYRLKVVGRANVPEKGGALLVSNHVSFIDALFLIASLDRPVRFLVDAAYFERPWLRPFLKALGAIPLAPAEGPRALPHALEEAGTHLDAGELVCLFPEGQLTRTGTLLPFGRHLERLAQGRGAAVVPVHLDRVWGSIFSRAGGRAFVRVPERVPYPVTVTFGTPLPPQTPAHEVRQAVQDLGEAAWALRKADARPLHHAFVRAARRHPSRLAFADATRPRVSYLRALAEAVALARALGPHWRGQELVGVLLPPGVAGALVNVAAALTGRTVVNLNDTAGPAGMASAARQASLRTAVTSRAFVEGARLGPPEGVTPVWLEDVAPGRAARLGALLLALAAPVRLLERACGALRRPAVDDVAAVIFSSGSTGEPKGVLLSHFNIAANVEAVAQVVRLEPDDRLLATLPLSHSLGCMALWFAASQGVGVVFHPDPLDAAGVGGLVERYRVTLLLAAPTFLGLYLRGCKPAQLGSLRLVFAGAEKLPERLAQAFEDHFGIRPLEGYGTTECAPVVAVSTPDVRAAGLHQAGSRRGFVGQPLPGIAVRVVDPESFAPLPPLTPGLLLVKGPNVMRGYLGRDDLTAQVMRDGWYVTGDVGVLDEDGFLRITDRLSRFSKVGGEMVPHERVEEALQEAAGAAAQVFAVTAVPDEKRGERLAVLHTLDEAGIPALLEKVAAGGLPDLFLPRREQFVKVDRLPVLGTGKLDLREVKRIATEMLAAPD